jgi:hypothetical protein
MGAKLYDPIQTVHTRKIGGMFTVAFSVLLCLLVFSAVCFVSASTGVTYLANDFDEDNFQVDTGYAIINSKLTMVPADGSDTFSAWYVPEMLTWAGCNGTSPTVVYIAMSLNVSWASGEGIQDFEIQLRNSSDTEAMLMIVKNGTDGFYLSAKVGETAVASNDFLTLPDTFVLSYDGHWFILYNCYGTVLASAEPDFGSQTFEAFGFKAWQIESAFIDSYGFYSTLDKALQGAVVSEANSNIQYMIPVVAGFAVLAAVAGSRRGR